MTTLSLTFNERMDLQLAIGARILQYKKFIEDVESTSFLPSSEKLAAHYRAELAAAQELYEKLLIA